MRKERQNTEERTTATYSKIYVLRPSRSCNDMIGFAEMIAYSGLVSKINKVKGNLERAGQSVSELAKATGLSRNNTVPCVLSKLESIELAYKDENLWFASQDLKNNFLKRKDRSNLPWYGGFQFFKAAVPVVGSPVTCRQSYLLWLMRHKPDQADMFYAYGLRIDPKTIRSAKKKLALLGGSDEAESEKWYKHAGEKKVRRVDEYAGIKPKPPHPDSWLDNDNWNQRCKDVVEFCRSVGWSDESIRDSFEHIFTNGEDVAAIFIQDILLILEYCQKVFEDGRHKYTTTTCREYYDFFVANKWAAIFKKWKGHIMHFSIRGMDLGTI